MAKFIIGAMVGILDCIIIAALILFGVFLL